MKKIKIKINGQVISCLSEKSIRQAAKENGIDIPGLCDHPDFEPKANCRICIVEVKGQTRHGKLVMSCATKAVDGMEVRTDTNRVRKARNLNIELIFAEHIERCASCIWRVNCKLLDMADKYKILITTFRDRKGSRQTYKFSNAIEIDGTQCIDCRNCVDACSKMQRINYLEIKGKGIDQEIAPTKNKKIDCIYCGQCAVHCPVGAAQEQSSWEMVGKVLKDKKRIVIAQISPAVTVSIGEEFGVENGRDMSGQVISSCRELGFDYVYDASIYNDIAAKIEARELLGSLKSKNSGPLITSSCPAWIKYVEFYYPKLAVGLAKTKSPQIIGGALAKKYLARELNINPKNIMIVTVAPCTAQKHEASRRELKIKNLWPVDYVITTRELAWLIKKNNIDFTGLRVGGADRLFDKNKGASIAFEAAGGHSEAVMRAASHLSKSKKNAKLVLDRKEWLGSAGIKKAEVEIAGKSVKIAAVNGIGNIEKVLSNLSDYDYVEVRVCPDGCIGGGGQPITTGPQTRKARLLSLRKQDRRKKMKEADKNTQTILSWIEKQRELGEAVLYKK